MKLTLIQEADFRRNEKTNLDLVRDKRKLDLGPNDVVCFISKSRDQLIFVWKPMAIDVGPNGRRKGEGLVVRSQRLRLEHATWDPLMLRNYADEVGIELQGIRRFEEIMKKIREAA